MTTAMASSGTIASATLPEGMLVATLLPRGDGSSAETIVAAEIFTYATEDGGRVDILATHTWTTRPDDTPADTIIRGRLIPGMLLEQQVPAGPTGQLGGVITRTVGDLEFANPDGVLDELAGRSVDGRRVTVMIGRARAAEAGAPEQWLLAARAFVGAGDCWEPSLSTLRLALRDAAEALRSPVSPNRYAGTGGAEGAADLKDRAKPKTFGRCLNVQPVLVDAQRLIYQLHDGRMQGVLEVRDRGVALTGTVTSVLTYAALEAAPTQPGGYLLCLATGHFRLGSPPAGTITCDVEGEVTATYPGWAETWSDGTLWSDGTGWSEPVPGHGYGARLDQIVLSLLAIGGWTLDRIDRGSFFELAQRLPGRMGIHVPAGASATIQDVIGELCGGIGVAAGPDRLGRYRLALIAPPAAQTRRWFEGPREILELEQLTLPWRVPARSWTVGYARHWTVQADADLAGAVALERRQELAQACRQVTVTDPTARVLHLTSRDSEMVPTHLVDEVDARAAALRLLALYGPGRSLFRATVAKAFAADIGHTVGLRYPRFGLADGRAFTVVGAAYGLDSATTGLTLLG